MLLPLLILASLGYVAFAISVIVRERRCRGFRETDEPHPAMKFVFAGGVPLVITSTMTYLFLIVGGATTVQFNVGNPSRMNVWSTWVDLWPMFLFITAASGFGSLIWFVVSVFKKTMRPSIPISIISLSLSVLALFTVASYFPSA
ncbi:hypothetical protein FEM03_22300 [Phragmitibacter flavus]|uniref:Uncharacterized protein n=1 Tax=Phragmitibacter flavus TaxID=2576071 RepID=A0A5R8KAH6_9BACT|nr:hypothetical protein [Phragmitibacter flavus]TLD68539.1 hypothetical protein FEM03_22300 [Phragmitibacter flavus]